MTATYNYRNIMQTAWARTREAMRSGYAADQLRAVFADCLRQAWRLAKAAARDAAMTIDHIERAILSLEMQTRMSPGEMDKLRHLRCLLSSKRDSARREAKSILIEEAGGQFVSVTFTKQDGSLRRMKVQPAALKGHVKGGKASPAGRKAAATRKARHPHLMPVWDVENAAIRSINLATVQSIRTGGQTHTFD